MAIILEGIKELVWRKGTVIPGYDPEMWRQDFAGAWICKDAFGSHSDYGWEIEHIRPLSQGGEETIENLMPCQWQNNMAKANNFPNFKSMITSDGNRNVRKEQSWVIQR